MTRLAIGALLALAGCGYSVEEVGESEARFSVTVPAAWDQVGTCLAAAYATELEALYLPVPSERRARIITKFRGGGFVVYQSIMYVFDIEGGDQGTKVTFRRRPQAVESADIEARERIATCGKA